MNLLTWWETVRGRDIVESMGKPDDRNGLTYKKGWTAKVQQLHQLLSYMGLSCYISKAQPRPCYMVVFEPNTDESFLAVNADGFSYQFLSPDEAEAWAKGFVEQGIQRSYQVCKAL